MPGIYHLQGVVKHYEWGGLSFLPSLLQTGNTANKPFAEYWMGTHPLGMGRIKAGNDPWKELTDYTGKLPFLLKILDVRDMLSIQVHPSKAAAELEFARENAEGIPLDAPQRNYKDDNHKPELIVALSDFWLLHGFKPAEELVYTLLNVVELRELLPVFNQSGYAGLYKYVMEMPQAEVNRILQPLADNIASIYNEGGPDRYDEDYWAAKAVKTFTKHGNIDRGIFSIYLFNLVHLKKGEGIFQAAGVPHAYLEGQNVEIMASSDNVLRGGLTTKHIDVKELLKHVKFEAMYPAILEGETNHHPGKIYRTPVPDFQLGVMELKSGETISILPAAAEILLCTEGVLELKQNNNTIMLEKGTPAAVVLPEGEIQLIAKSASTIYKATVAPALKNDAGKAVHNR